MPSFIKYSNQRADYLKIRTEIRPEQWVRKIAVDKCGSGHIQNLLKNAERARRQYAGTLLTLPEAIGSKYVYSYPFLKGKSLMQELDDTLEDDRDAFLGILRLWQDNVRKAHDNAYFSMTKEFITIFGDEYIPSQLRSGSVNNVDIVFDNIILQNGKWMVIDTEWSYLFPIPVEFILYRAFFYYVIRRDLNNDFVESCWKLLEIDKQLLGTFQRMEAHFQAYILGRNKQLVT